MHIDSNGNYWYSMNGRFNIIFFYNEPFNNSGNNIGYSTKFYDWGNIIIVED